MAAAVTRSGVTKALRDVGEIVEEEDEIITTALGLSRQFGLSSGDFANNWESYTVNHTRAGGGGGEGQTGPPKLSVKALHDMADTLKKMRAISSSPIASGSAASARTAPKGGKLVTPRTVVRTPVLTKADMDGFSTTTVTKRPLEATTDSAVTRVGSAAAAAAAAAAATTTTTGAVASTPNFRPPKAPRRGDGASTIGGTGGQEDTRSPISVQSPPDLVEGRYDTRTNAGQRLLSYSPAKLSLPTANAKSSAASDPPPGLLRCRIKSMEEVGVTKPYRFMFTPLDERARALERGLLHLRQQMVERHGLSGELTPAGIPRQETVNVVGRICCETAEGRINKTSIILEGSRRESGGLRVHLAMDEMKSFALFPGQVVAARGINSSGTRMVVQGLIEGVPRPLPTTPVAELQHMQHGTVPGCAGGNPLAVMMATGPYTTADNLNYQPLMDLLEVVRKTRPDVVILAGPFVDDTHPAMVRGRAKLEVDDGQEEHVDFETLFRYRVSGKLDAFFKGPDGVGYRGDCKTQFVLVPSLKDPFHEYVYPQPPLHDRVPGGETLRLGGFEEAMFTLDLPLTGGSEKRVHLVSNPAMFKVNEVVFGISTTDVLFDLSCDESSLNTGNRLARLTEHLLQQQSFYPIFPPPAQSRAQLDLRHAAKWRMPVSPDVLIVPSKLAHFARDVQGTLCVNPGQLAKGTCGGTFATMTIHPMTEEGLTQAQSGGEGSATEGRVGGAGGGAAAGGGGGGGDEAGGEEADAVEGVPHKVAERSTVTILRI